MDLIKFVTQIAVKKYSSTYIAEMKALFGANIVQYLTLGDLTGAVAVDESGNGLNGAYTAVTLGQTGIGDGYKSAYFDGVSSTVNLYSAGLDAPFDPEEGGIIIWSKIPQAAWDDNTSHEIVHLGYNGNNYINMVKNSTNRITMTYDAGATVSQRIMTSVADTGWVCLGITWSKSNDRVNTYRKGVQAGATLTSLGTWSGALAATQCFLGRTDTWKMLGYEAHYMLINREVTAEEMLAASNFNPAAAFAQTSWNIPQGGGVPAVILTFDDEYESVYTEAFKNVLEPLGIPATFYVMTDAIDGVSTPTFITTAELLEMDAAGWSIANHTTDQTTLSDVDVATATAKIADAKAVLDGMGLTKASMHLSYPNGGYDADVKTAAIAAGILTGRRVYDSPARFPDYVAANNYEIWSTMRMGSGETIQAAMLLVDQAIAEGKTILFYGHKLIDPATDTTMWETWRLRALVWYCVSKNLPFLTINDYYDLQSAGKTITRTPL